MIRTDAKPHGLPGVFIALEGGDCCGKTTQRDRLESWLTQQGIPALITHEPGDTPLGKTLRELVLHGDHMCAQAEALLFAADRADHVDRVVRPALARGEVVVTDRYIDSSVAYQGAARGLGSAEIRGLSLWATDGLLPDFTILLDLDPIEAVVRRGTQADRLEAAGLDFHNQVRTNFLEQARQDPGRYLVVDAELSVEEIAAQIKTALSELFLTRGYRASGR